MSSTTPRTGLQGLITAVTLVASGLCSAGAAPGQVWRCEVAGRITYADQPCREVLAPAAWPGTIERAVQAADPRSAAQQRQAQEAARSEERLLRQLQQERRLRERQAARPAGAVIIGLPPDPLGRHELKRPTRDDRDPPRGARSGARTSAAVPAASRRAPG